MRSVKKAFTMCQLLFFGLLLMQTALYAYTDHGHIHVVFFAILGIIFTSLMKRSHSQWKKSIAD